MKRVTLRFLTVLGLFAAVLAVMVQVGLGDSKWPCNPSIGVYEGIELFPVAILSENSIGPSCSPWYAMGIGSPTTVSNKLPQAFSMPFAVGSAAYPVRTVNPALQILYTITGNDILGTFNQLMSFQLEQSSYSHRPITLEGGIYSIQNYFLNLSILHRIDFHPTQEVIYFLGEQFDNNDDGRELIVGYFNTPNNTAPVVYKGPVVFNYMDLVAGALDTVKSLYAFTVTTTSTTGISYVYSLLTGQIVSSQPFTSSSSFWNCTEWAFDPVSGNIYGVYSNPQGGIYFGIVDPSTATVSNIAMLYEGPASVVPATLAIDYQLGNGYLFYQVPTNVDNVSQFDFIQFDPTSGKVLSTTSTTESKPVWAIYAPWLTFSYY